MFDYRLASHLGRTVAEMKASMTQREYLGWQRYWSEEPWGSWRDNLHAAIIARSVMLPHLRDGKKVQLGEFFYRRPEERQREANRGLVTMLRLVSGGKQNG